MSTQKSGIIGIVGGMGPQAGVALHEAIIRYTEADNDQDHLSVILATFPGEIADRTAFLEGTTLINPAKSILTVVDKLVSLGVGVIGLACNTSHVPAIFEPIQNTVKGRYDGVELVYLPSAVIDHLRQKHPESKKIGLMATNGTYHSRIYQDILWSNGYEVVVPDIGFQDCVIHKMIYDTDIGIKANSIDITPEAISLWYKALDFFKEEEVDTIVLGCTELSLIYLQDVDKEITFIDTTEVLAKALIREATLPLFQKDDMGSKLFDSHNY